MKPKQLTTERETTRFAVLSYVLGTVALTLLLVAAIAVTGAAAETEYESDPFELGDENDTITVEAHWLDDAQSSATAGVVVYNATAYNDDPENATAIASIPLEADPGNSTTAEVGPNDGLAVETEYVAVVTGDDTDLEDVEFSDGTGGAVFASTDQRNIAVVAVLVLGSGYVYTRDD